MCPERGGKGHHTTHLTHVCNSSELLFIFLVLRHLLHGSVNLVHVFVMLMRLWFYFPFQDKLWLCPNQGILGVLFSLPWLRTWLHDLYATCILSFVSCRTCCMLWTTKFDIRLITLMFTYSLNPSLSTIKCRMGLESPEVKVFDARMTASPKYYYYYMPKKWVRTLLKLWKPKLCTNASISTLTSFVTKFSCAWTL